LLRILPALATRPLSVLVAYGVMISVTAIVVRFVWVFGAERLSRVFTYGASAPTQGRELFVLSWAGMRGVVSLATVLALPLETPERDLLLLLTFCVILVTLVGQGLSLPWLVRAQYVHRASHLDAPPDGMADVGEQELLEHRQIRQAVLDAERAAVVDLRRRGGLDDHAHGGRVGSS
jgi:NhaP-type Na+/H+ or K+/H+ antiporter